MRVSVFRNKSASVVLYLAAATLWISLPPRAIAEEVVREQQAVVVQGAQEIWKLVWDGKPSTVCGPDRPDDVAIAITCPCSGLAYGEYGNLSLVRRRGGSEVDRMDLGPLFGEADYPEGDQGAAYLQRWPAQSEDLARADRGDADLVSEIKHRPAPVIMKLADYDRGGAATEFLLQVGTLPCGKHQFAAVGVTARNPHLHALTSAGHPEKALIMPLSAWDALLSGPGPTAVTTWPCDDHGADIRTELVVSASNGKIRVKEREFSCPTHGEPETLVKETDW